MEYVRHMRYLRGYNTVSNKGVQGGTVGYKEARYHVHSCTPTHMAMNAHYTPMYMATYTLMYIHIHGHVCWHTVTA